MLSESKRENGELTQLQATLMIGNYLGVLSRDDPLNNVS